MTAHIGVSEKFKLGQYSRIGQSCDGTACGAACGALQYCLNANNAIPSALALGADPLDYQMNVRYIKIVPFAAINLIQFFSLI